MASLDHWHPVLFSRDLKKEPAAVRLLGQEIVLFRTARGTVGALDDVCPHRRMRLSLGKVLGDRLQCAYHGWTFECDGRGESPGTPKLHACARKFDVVEKQGAIWVKEAGMAAEFPPFDISSYYNICNLSHRVKAPLELVVDNFCEIEHTPTTHDLFGYALDQMHRVEVEYRSTAGTVRAINRGPSKRLSRPLRWLLGIGPGYDFIDDWTTYFSPVYSVYDHWWADPQTGKESFVRWRLYIFFVPMTDYETSIMTFAFTKSSWPGPAGGARLLKFLMRRKLDYEIRLDVRTLEGLADKSTSIEGMILSRFDKVLGLNRDRIERVYRGRDEQEKTAGAFGRDSKDPVVKLNS